MLPEQIWDAADIPALELFRGKPYRFGLPARLGAFGVHQAAALDRDGRIFDQPPQTVERYQVQQHTAAHSAWRFNNKTSSMPIGKSLRLVLLSPAMVHWSIDGWLTWQDVNTRDTGLGVHIVYLPTAELRAGSRVCFTFYWFNTDKWEGSDFEVVAEPEATRAKNAPTVNTNEPVESNTNQVRRSQYRDHPKARHDNLSNHERNFFMASAVSTDSPKTSIATQVERRHDAGSDKCQEPKAVRSPERQGRSL